MSQGALTGQMRDKDVDADGDEAEAAEQFGPEARPLADDAA